MSPPAGKPRRSRPAPSQPKDPEKTPDQASSSASSPSPLGLAGGAFVKPQKAPPAATAADLERQAQDAPRPAPIEWTPERMEVVVRGFGYVLHAVDPVADSPLAPDLWKLTEDDAKAIAEPATRIANRYAIARGAAGFSDEIGVAAALAPYVKRNLAERGRVRAAHQLEERDQPGQRYQPETPAPEPPSPPESQPGSEQEIQPDVRLAAQAGDRAGSEEDLLRASKSGVADAFEHSLPVPGAEDVHLPPLETERG